VAIIAIYLKKLSLQEKTKGVWNEKNNSFKFGRANSIYSDNDCPGLSHQH
jgi:hypothetical protein